MLQGLTPDDIANSDPDQQLARVEQAIVVLHGGGPVRQELHIVEQVNQLA